MLKKEEEKRFSTVLTELSFAISYLGWKPRIAFKSLDFAGHLYSTAIFLKCLFSLVWKEKQ